MRVGTFPRSFDKDLFPAQSVRIAILGEFARGKVSRVCTLAVVLTHDIPANEIYESVPIHGLSEESNRASFQVERLGILGRLPRHNDDGDRRVTVLDVLEKLEPAQVWHVNISDNTTAPGQSTGAEKLLGREVAFRFVATGRKQIDQ